METRWLLKDSPHEVRFKNVGDKIHKEVHQFNELTSEKQSICKSIKHKINSILPSALVYLIGSQINGRHRVESDYDVLILWMATPSERKQLKEFNYGVEVDVRFSHSYSGHKVLIP